MLCRISPACRLVERAATDFDQRIPSQHQSPRRADRNAKSLGLGQNHGNFTAGYTDQLSLDLGFVNVGSASLKRHASRGEHGLPA